MVVTSQRPGIYPDQPRLLPQLVTVGGRPLPLSAGHREIPLDDETHISEVFGIGHGFVLYRAVQISLRDGSREMVHVMRAGTLIGQVLAQRGHIVPAAPRRDVG